ncbi:MAG TPA: type IV secretory system conjugative DNA transfer family protein [Solirubrobacterales bacterium]
MSEEARIYWVAGAIGATVLTGIWLTGASAAAIFGSGWTPIRLDQLLASALRLPSHLGDPRSAWPRGNRAALPGAVGFYAVGVFIFGALSALAIFASRGAERFGLSGLLSGGRQRPPSARMATKRDLRAISVPSPQPKRLMLGRYGKTLLAAEEGQSAIVFAPTQTFKTTGFTIPTLLEWEGPVLVTSIKNDLLGPTLARRRSMGEVMIFDPAKVTKMPSARATPLWGATNWRGAMRVAHWLMSAANISGSEGLQDANFWSATAEKLLAPLLFATAANGRPISDVARWLDEGPEASQAEVDQLLGKTGVAEAQRSWQATLNREERQLSSIYLTADTAMRAFSDPHVAEETAAADYSPAMLLDGKPNTLYLCAPRSEQERLRPLFSMIVQELVGVVEELHAAKGEPLDPPLLLLLDEAANIAPVPDLDELAATAAGLGVQLLSVFQDFTQVHVRWGRRAWTVLNNHAAKIVGSGISDRETVDFFTHTVGAGEFEQRSRTAGEKGHKSTTEGDTYRDLAPPSVLRETKPGAGLLVYKHLPAAEIGLRPWFRERSLRELREVSPGDPAAKEV